MQSGSHQPEGLGHEVSGAVASAPQSLPDGDVLAVAEALQTVRNYLDMDVAFVSEFIGDKRIFRYVDSKTGHAPLAAGDELPLSSGYCNMVVQGTLPALIPDTAALPLCQACDVTHRLPIGAHLSVPLRRQDGAVYGTFCCFNYRADTSLNERDLRLMQMFGTMISRRIDLDARRACDQGSKIERIRGVLERGEPRLVYQPVFRLRDGALLGAEALSRFPGMPVRSPDLWFGEAASVGLQVELEVQAIRNAIAEFEQAWRLDGTLRLAVNAAPATILSGLFHKALRDAPVERLALEITEHDRVEDYPRLGVPLSALRRRGCKITVDDAGSGYASLRHILQIEPETIKLDISLTRGIDASAGKRALAGGLIEFARQTGCVIIAEGVETEAELAALRELRVNSAQGYLLGRPAPLDALCRRIVAGGQADRPISDCEPRQS